MSSAHCAWILSMQPTGPSTTASVDTECAYGAGTSSWKLLARKICLGNAPIAERSMTKTRSQWHNWTQMSEHPQAPRQWQAGTAGQPLSSACCMCPYVWTLSAACLCCRLVKEQQKKKESKKKVPAGQVARPPRNLGVSCSCRHAVQLASGMEPADCFVGSIAAQMCRPLLLLRIMFEAGRASQASLDPLRA